jgi:hypothetical protein
MTGIERRLLAALFAVIVVAMGLVWAAASYAYTCDTTGCTWQTSYTEPATLTNGQPLTDLQSCTATYTVSKDGAASDPALTKSFVIPASKPAGGGVVVKNNSDPGMLPPHTYAITERIACTSTAFGASAPSAPASLPMNSGVALPPATNLTLQ